MRILRTNKMRPILPQLQNKKVIQYCLPNCAIQLKVKQLTTVQQNQDIGY